ncbi:hypothetical protein KIPB_013893 [Kipferlia bialata]|uniref:Calcineurin-like phosphoesterase domain-containing protein n=1 Tax=Kipferlia bialata TaxID=797122 RepID=A0A9K3GQG7_9EUKA|nr:hypothetical protein KIPB_013893 [Kipferlia bialata]|eukprot:g13893.t1
MRAVVARAADTLGIPHVPASVTERYVSQRFLDALIAWCRVYASEEVYHSDSLPRCLPRPSFLTVDAVCSICSAYVTLGQRLSNVTTATIGPPPSLSSERWVRKGDHDRALRYSRAVVIGDIHGSMSALLHILDAVGPPSPTNQYCFLGDYVRMSCLLS